MQVWNFTFPGHQNEVSAAHIWPLIKTSDSSLMNTESSPDFFVRLFRFLNIGPKPRFPSIPCPPHPPKCWDSPTSVFLLSLFPHLDSTPLANEQRLILVGPVKLSFASSDARPDSWKPEEVPVPLSSLSFLYTLVNYSTNHNLPAFCCCFHSVLVLLGTGCSSSTGLTFLIFCFHRSWNLSVSLKLFVEWLRDFSGSKSRKNEKVSIYNRCALNGQSWYFTALVVKK